MNGREPARRLDLAAAGVLLAVTTGFFTVLELREPYYFLWDDNASFYLPSYVYNHDAMIGRGELPHLNFHQYLGHTHLASGQTAVLYPPLYLGLGIVRLTGADLRAAIDVLAVLHLVLAALGMFVLLRRLGVDGRIALLASLLWSSFPFPVVVSRSWLIVAYAAAFLPWSLWSLERLLERPRGSRILAAAAIKALFFLQGYVQYVVLATLFEGVYLILRWLSGPRSESYCRRQALAWGASLAAAGLLAAPLLVPMLYAKEASAYRAEALSFEEFLSNAMRLETFFPAQVFEMEERAVHLSTGAIFYVGIPNLLVLAVLFRKRRRAPFTIAAVVAVLAGILSTRAFGMMYFFPLLSSFRWPFKSFLIALFFLTVAAAGAYDELFASSRRAVRGLAVVLLAAGLAANASIVFSKSLDAPFGPNRIDVSVRELRAEAARRFPLDRGRVVSLWISPGEPRLDRLLIFNYATLAGAYHLGGYDPLIARENLELALRLDYSNIFRQPLTAERLAYLSSWSVRFLLVPESRLYPGIDRLRAALPRFPQLRLSYREEGLEVWENGAALPFAFFVGPPVTPVEVSWGTSSLRLRVAGRGGRLRVNVAPLAGYEWSVDGRGMGPVGQDTGRHVVVDVPAGAQEVEIRYVDVPFRLGTAIFVSFLLALAARVWILKRRAYGR